MEWGVECEGHAGSREELAGAEGGCVSRECIAWGLLIVLFLGFILTAVCAVCELPRVIESTAGPGNIPRLLSMQLAFEVPCQ